MLDNQTTKFAHFKNQSGLKDLSPSPDNVSSRKISVELEEKETESRFSEDLLNSSFEMSTFSPYLAILSLRVFFTSFSTLTRTSISSACFFVFPKCVNFSSSYLLSSFFICSSIWSSYSQLKRKLNSNGIF